MEFIAYVPSRVCPLCGFERREGDTHMAYFEDRDHTRFPRYGCRVLSEVHFPSASTVIKSD